MYTKRISLLLAALLLLMAFAACTSEEPAPSPVEPANDPSPAQETPAEDPGRTWETAPVVAPDIEPVPEGAVDFSDGNTGYMSVNLTPGGADPSQLEIIDFNGGKALKVSLTENGQPYLGFDVSSMLGDRIADVRAIETRIYAESPDGEFHAISGNLTTWTGADAELEETAYLWGIAIERNNPRTLVAELTRFFEPGFKNIMVITKTGDTIKDANTAANDEYNARMTAATEAGEEFTEEPPVPQQLCNLIIDYVRFLDESGAPIPADTTVSFDPPRGFGDADRTMLYTFEEEITLDFNQDGATGSSTAWGQAGKVLDLDFSLLKPGAVFNVYYKSDKAPELIFQSWADEKPASVEALNSWCKVAPYTTNFSGNIAQFRYEDIVAVCGDENFADWLSCINIGDWGVDLTVSKFTIGQRNEEELGYKPVVIGHDGFIDLMPFNVHANAGHSDGAWSQCYRIDTANSTENPASFDTRWLVEGCYIVANYASEKGTQFIFQRFVSEPGAGDEIWGNLTGTSRSGGFMDPLIGIDCISYEGILEMWEEKGGVGFDDQLGAFWIQDDGAAYDLFNLVLYTPNFNPPAEETAAE
ncbi:MAG: hypothetical protein LBR72_05405 [Oscillospiraceae bacterium]|jgi:hypothetical protein|nr:hypothetical protein [Oscillospiraceae bacterium]